MALRKTRIEELAKQGKGSARAVSLLRDDPERFLATVQIGITVISATAAAFGGEAIAMRLIPQLRRVEAIGERAEGVALALVVAGVSYLSIVLGELVPKSLALRHAEAYALSVGRVILALAWLARPLVWLLGVSANLILKPLGDRTNFTEARHSAEELQEIVEEAAKAGTINAEAGEIASRALELPELTAADVMVPRQYVVMLELHATLEAVRRTLREHPHSRFPVYEGRVDNVIGYVSVRDVLAADVNDGDLATAGFLRAPFFVPESKRAMDLLKEMRSRQTPLAIVVEELGGLAGIVTLEDVIEELVGEIFSEHDTVPVQPARRDADGSFVVSGLMPVRDANRLLDLELPEDGSWNTIGGLCLAMASKIPRVGDRLQTTSGITLEVLDASPRRVRSVRIRAAHS